MNYFFNGEILNYDYYKNGENLVLFLHGWGGDKTVFTSTINLLKSKFSILSITLPTTSPTFRVWTMWDYCQSIINILQLFNYKNLYIICHSFGFRIATLLAQKIDIKKMVITGGAGMKKLSIFKKIEQQNISLLLKQNRFKFLYKKVASRDYISLPKTNKKTFKNIVNLRLDKLQKFTFPLLLFWGKKDTSTKLWIAKKLKQKNNCKLIVTNGNHFTYLTDNFIFNNSVLEFLC